MRAYDIGLSAIRSHTRTLNTIGNNIANAATPGYHRQRVNLITRMPEIGGDHITGEGVEVGSIRRVVDIATPARTTNLQVYKYNKLSHKYCEAIFQWRNSC